MCNFEIPSPIPEPQPHIHQYVLFLLPGYTAAEMELSTVKDLGYRREKKRKWYWWAISETFRGQPLTFPIYTFSLIFISKDSPHRSEWTAWHCLSVPTISTWSLYAPFSLKYHFSHLCPLKYKSSFKSSLKCPFCLQSALASRSRTICSNPYFNTFFFLLYRNALLLNMYPIEIRNNLICRLQFVIFL